MREVDRDGIPPRERVTLAAADLAPRIAWVDGRHGRSWEDCSPVVVSSSRSSSASRLAIGTRDNPVEQPLFDDRPRIESGLELEKGTLRVYNWADYINPAVLKGFTKEFGNEVEVTTFYNSQEAVQKLRTGKISFDVFFPTQDDLPKYVAGKLLQPLNHDYIPNP